MSLTKAQLQGLNTTNFPNNTTGYITPALLREFNSQSVDSMALQTQVDSLSSSFQSQLNGLEDFSSSLVTNFATVTQLNASSSTLQSNINGRATTGSVNTLSQSVYVGFSDQATINSNTINRFNADELAFNQYTQSNNAAVAGKASLSVNNSFVGDQYVTGNITATGTVTGSNITSFALPTASFNSYTASQNFINGTLVTTSSFNTFSGSQYKADSASFSSRIEAVTGSVTSAITASSLITASVSQSTITFTKGDGSTFNIVVADISGGASINTGSFATTGSNSFRGTQTLLETGSWGGVLLNVQSGSIKFNGQVADSGFSGTGSIFLSPVNLPHGSTKVVFQTEYQSGSTTPNGYDYILGIGRQGDTTTKTVDLGTDVTLDVSRATLVGFPFTTTSSFNLFSGSQYKGDSSSFDSRINAITSSGGSINTGSFATTGSNSFTGSQTINGNIILTGSNAEIQNAKGVGIYNSGYNLDYKLTMPIQNTIGYIDELNLPHYYNGGVQPTISASATINNRNLVKVTPQQWFNLTASVGDNHSGILAVEQSTGWDDINNTFGVHGNLVTSGSVNYVTQRGLSKVGIFKLGGSIAEPYIGQPIYVDDNGYQLTLGYPTGSRVLRYGYVASFEQSDPLNMYVRQIYVDPVWEKGETITDLNVSSSLRVTGSLIVSGGATLIGSQWFSDAADTNSYSALSEWSGSLILSAKGYYTASFPQLTSSLANAAGTGFVNLLFKGDSTAGNTILSGSSNILGNPVAPTATFYRQVGNGNLALTGLLPQVSASMLFPITMNGNTILGASGNPIIMRGPVSSSAWTINSNNILGGITLGGTTANHAERIVNGLTVTANSVAGVLSIFANQSTLAGNASSIQQNNINGQPSLILSSSNITFNGNTINSTPTITNQYFSGSLGFGNLAVSNNTIGGGAHTLIVSGGMPAGAGGNPSIGSTAINGVSNTIYSNVAGANVSSSVVQASSIATHIFGANLIVSASAGAAQFNTIGSAFIGRYNDISGNKAKTGETVFAIGTGNTTNRKTGFLIDSGSNTFVEGTLNVSGSTSTTGSITIQSGSGDLFVHGHKQFNVGAFQSNINQSGSAGVSQSMQFEVTDLSYGVTMVSNSQITIANAGTYNIQFSAQLLADAGADDVYIWLKKNGTNVSATAGHVTLANNDEAIAAWNYVIDAATNDYYEIVWQSTAGDAILLAEAASGNIPSIPSVILTVTQAR